jgi:hypothetical protein
VAIPYVGNLLLVGGAALVLVLAVLGAVLLLTRDRGPRDGGGDGTVCGHLSPTPLPLLPCFG